jgi:hypothetical protein
MGGALYGYAWQVASVGKFQESDSKFQVSSRIQREKFQAPLPQQGAQLEN